MPCEQQLENYNNALGAYNKATNDHAILMGKAMANPAIWPTANVLNDHIETVLLPGLHAAAEALEICLAIAQADAEQPPSPVRPKGPVRLFAKRL